MQVEELTTAAELTALRPEWSGLWNRCPRATPFQTPEWLLPWWDVFGNGTLAALAFYRSGRLAGFAPLFLDAAGAVRLMGEGISDYLDALAEPGCERDVAQALVAHLEAGGRPWDFQDLPESSPLLCLGEPARAFHVCPVVDLPGCVDQWRGSLPAGLRRALRRSDTRAAGLEIARPETSPEFLDALFRLHTERWDGAGVLAGTPIREFHRRAAAGLLERGVLRFFGLRIEGCLRAVLYSFGCAGRAWLYLSGFDPAIAPLSPGTLLLEAAIEEAIRAGLRQADFLRGDEPYKYRWGARDHPTYRWVR